MNIAATQYNLKNKAFEIYLSGCDGKCKGCHNKELQDYSIGRYYKLELDDILDKINDFDLLIDHVWILGGEPLLQNLDELRELLYILKHITKKRIWLWTRFDLKHIQPTIINQCDYIKTGEYIEELKCENNVQHGINLASSNQKIIKT